MTLSANIECLVIYDEFVKAGEILSMICLTTFRVYKLIHI